MKSFLVKNILIVVIGLALTSGYVYAQNTNVTDVGSGAETIKFENPLEYNKVEGLLGNAMEVLRGLVGALAVLMIVIGGVMWTVSGTTGQTEMAKSMIKASLIGLAIVLGAPSLLLEVYRILGKEPAGVDTKLTIFDIVVRTTQTILGFVGALSVLMIVVGGIMWVTSQDDTAKKIVKAAIIGLVIALTSLVVVNAVAGIFGSGV